MKLMELDIQRFAFFLYDIVYYANDGTSDYIMRNYNNQSDALWTNTYTRTGYTFSGWNTAADGTGTDIPLTSAVGDVYTIVGGGVANLYAQWTANEDKYITLENLTRYDRKIKEYVDYQDIIVSNNLAPTYDATSTYDIGDYVIYNKLLYVCSTAILVAEAWTAAHWSRTTAADILGNLNSVLASLTTPSNNGGGN